MAQHHRHPSQGWHTPNGLRLLAVLAHPDDESLGLGGVLARYAAEGVETFILTATRGERGRFYDDSARPSEAEVGRVREAELRAAARELEVAEVSLLDYRDGDLDRADPTEAVSRIAQHVRRIRPQVVVTFAPDGAYGHPDHIAISQLTTTALLVAADPAHAPGVPHRVAKLYYLAWPPRVWELYQQAFKKLVSVVDGVQRQATPWPEWMLTTRVDARAHWQTVWRAVGRHKTQLAIYGRLHELRPEQHQTLWGDQHFCRILSTVNGGRQVEQDLFAGLR